MNKPTQSLDLRQSQNLVMTPQLQQAIKMLQLSNVELSEFIEEELEKNPLLEKAEQESDAPTQTEDTSEPQEKDNIQDQFDDSFDAGTVQTGSGGDLKFEGNSTSFEDRLTGDKTLRDHLSEQLLIACDDGRDRMIGSLLIDQLDESGYLRVDHAQLAQQLGCSLERIEKLIEIMHGFDPTGIFAADLPECLALQLAEKKTLDEPMQKLLDNLDLIAKFEHKKLAQICGVNETYLQDMLAEIRELNPKPAGDFDHLIVQTAIPDVLMKRRARNVGGGWRVELNHETLPKVLVNQEYVSEISSMATQKKDKDYVNSQLASANWLIRAMDQRAQTILKTATAIIEEQDAFFNYGIEFLKPLTLKDIATEIDMHESTISRVTTGKYMGTPRGLFELKFFFSTALQNSDGIAHSSEAIKARIKALIDAEDPKKVLSDDKLVALLKEEKIDLARRTVAKYREAMHIGSSVQRRREKKNLT